MKTKYRYIILSNFILAGLSVGMMQNNAKADTTQADQSDQTAQVQATQVATQQATTDADISAQNTATTQAASETEDQWNPVQVNDPETTTPDTSTGSTGTTGSDVQVSQGEETPITNGLVTVGDSLAPLYDHNGTQLTVSLQANTGWYTDRQLAGQAGESYYRVSTDAYVSSSYATLSYGHDENGTVRVKGWGAKTYTRSNGGFADSGAANLGANTSWQYSKTDSETGLNYWQVGNNLWINSNDATTAPAYSNPAGYLQISNTQIQPDTSLASPGYNLYNGVEGIKVYLVRQYFGFSNSHTIYDGNVANAVRNFQSRNGLNPTGITDQATWEAMGFSSADWTGIDSYVAPLRTNENSTRSDHVEAMIAQAMEYRGQPWVSGAASSPAYGLDCSGLVTQAMYASGVSPLPVSAIQHAQPGHEWNSRDMWADWRMPHVSSADRQRGYLVFFTDPSTGIIWHVGILLDANTMIDSWPGVVGVSSIYAGKGNIAGFARVFA
ncbi:peptidoglycan-binding protein [Companilactobacillus versmoldensis]|uniref:NlpC/P60 domain-containing protein n=1 Tax=Companilactobacillus versmoldensis DSM 14857 = KCTC 3814 TaxID=1423815 RepID=A0A0R1SIN1_9LACO|nr:peptidoglycan-binding protein [Companilactobacillus versmoldensis]KRL67380.1 hypothetical protein FC27_GL001971 [Companilactobacillus versmoldensis DSM 14857 = KCTC 3814]